ncbi:hypothetical protein AMS68_002922 [Peltaster fructicola]|uniref:MSP domain-containing protein n=1 Tax=Peltaster fructicola TaxID=286661 RepID=A0A6H0XRZ4_9PEZI|nr:hypothetical protein AMS68_002922 [Peltaster fructicola]
MSVELQPTELGFKRPFTHEVSQVLRLHNPNTQSLAFKVKTTAPKQYCVRPNSGRIDPSGTVEVQVLLQAMKEDPPEDAKCRDKFLVQSVIIPSNAAPDANVTQIWQTVEATSKGSIQEKKIRVSFLSAGEQTNGVVAGATHDEDHLAPFSSPTPAAAATPQRSVPVAEAQSPTLVDQSIASVQSAAETVQNTASSAVAAVASAVPTTSEELNKQLEEAKATISRLQTQASEGLRQRKVTDSTTDTKSANLSLQNQPAPGGVPIQIVAALCLLFFIIAYLFF